MHEDEPDPDEGDPTYYTHGGSRVIVDKRRIAFHYLRGWFLVDMLASMPIDFASRAANNSLVCSMRWRTPCTHRIEASNGSAAFKLFKILRIFRVLKLFRLFRLKRLVNKYQDELVYWMPVISATKLMFALLWASHWMGCCYALVYPFQAKGLPSSLKSRYVACVYWAMQTITTVGYGDMTSSRDGARLVATGGMAIGGLIFGWLIQ